MGNRKIKIYPDKLDNILEIIDETNMSVRNVFKTETTRDVTRNKRKRKWCSPDRSTEKKLPLFYVCFFAPSRQSKKFRGHVRDTQLSN